MKTLSISLIISGLLLYGCCRKCEMTILTDLHGPNFSNWEVVLGDGIYAAPGEAPVDSNDIATINYPGYSELIANVKNRRIQAHNITFNRIVNDTALTCVHDAEYSFKLPYFPSTSSVDYNGQTIEGGLFVWDGKNSKIDYGIAFQWIVNPWLDPIISIWNGTGWDKIGSLPLDSLYHVIKFTLDVQNKNAWLTLDGYEYPNNCFSKTKKPEFGPEIAARFQAEMISIYPPQTGFNPSHIADFRDWKWRWTRCE